MKKIYTLLLVFTVLGTAGVKAQITIGSKEDSRTGALLDLRSNTNMGLLLPTVVLTNANTWAPLSGSQSDAVDGTMVYNSSPSVSNGLKGSGIYYWMKNQWNMAVNTQSSNTQSSGFRSSVSANSEESSGKARDEDTIKN